jgi:hypothetical protein
VTRLAAAAVAFAVAVFAQTRIDGLRGRSPLEHRLYMPSGEAVRKLWPRLEGLGADIYWLRTVQYFGGTRAFTNDKRFDLLAPLLNITVTLDPRFYVSYTYGSIFLYEVGQKDAADALMARGVAANPQNWRLRQHWGYCTFVYRHDAARASEILHQAADTPGAPFWLRSMAAQFLVKGGERATARGVWTELYKGGEGVVKELAKLNLQRLDAMDMAEQLEKAVTAYKERAGSFPPSLDAVRQAAGMTAAIPPDPTGTPFEYDPQTGRVRVSRSSMLWIPDLAR